MNFFSSNTKANTLTTDLFKTQLLFSIVFVSILAILTISVFWSNAEMRTRAALATPKNTALAAVSKNVATSSPAAIMPNPFTSIAIEGQSAIVVDLTTGELLYEKRPDSVRPLASITKLMTAIVANERIPQDMTIPINRNALLVEGDSNLDEQNQWHRDDLIGYVLVTSSNDGARALASAVMAVAPKTNSKEETTSSRTSSIAPFVSLMNNTAARIGMDRTVFANDTGLDAANLIESGGEGTARDVAMMLRYAILHHPHMFEPTREIAHNFHSVQGTSYRAVNTNKIIDEIPGVWASKTGFTDLAGGNLAVIISPDINRPVAIVVLGSSIEGRFTDVQKLAKATQQHYQIAYP